MRRLVMVLALMVPGRMAAAQAVHGRVVSPDSAMVPGAVVIASDSAGVPAVAALADDSGRFTVRFPSAGRFRIHVMRIGYATTTDAPFLVQAGETAERTIVAVGRRVNLPDEQRDASADCFAPETPSSVQLAWSNARTALLATQLTRLTRSFTEDVEVLTRREWADKRRPSLNDRTVIVGTAVRALTSVPPEVLADSGYVSHLSTGDRYQAPHEDVLLSESFLATHCLRLLPFDATAATVRVGFEPLQGRTVPDVRGTVTLDRVTLELRRVDFSYTNIGQAGRAGDATGEIVFRRLPDASWIAGSWLLTQSMAEQYVVPRPLVAGRFGAPPAARPEIVSGTSRMVTGGTVVRIRTRDSVVWSNDGDMPDASAASAPPPVR